MTARLAQAAACAGLLVMANVPASAQTVDYATFEALLDQPITTSATGLPSTVGDAPADLVILTADDIRRSGATGIAGVLAHVIGLDILQTGATVTEVAIRGYNQPLTPRLLVLVNGRQVYIDIYGATVWSALPVTLAEIRQIEIVRGPNSALFGFNAAGGVVNIVTWNPLHDDVRAVTVTRGNGDHEAGSGTATIRLGDGTAVRLSADGLRDDDFASNQAVADRVGTPHVAERTYAALSLHQAVANGEVELEATHVSLGQLEFPILAIPQYFRFNLDSLKGEYTGETSLGMVTARINANFTTIDSATFGLRVHYYNPLVVAQVQDVLKVTTDMSVRLSVEFRHSTVDTSPVGGGQIAYDIGSVGGTWNWRTKPYLSLTAAARLDDLSLGRTGTVQTGLAGPNALWNRSWLVPTANLGAVLNLGPADTLRLTGARGAQLPSLLALGALNLNFQGFLQDSGSPFVNPTIVTNGEIDWDHAIPSIGVTTRAAAFYQTNNQLQVEYGPPTRQPGGQLVGLSQNVGNSTEIGAEFSVRGDFGRGWRWSLGYSPRRVHDSLLRGAGVTRTGVDFEHTTPQQVGTASLGWTGGPWEIDGFARAQSASEGAYTTDALGYMLRPLGAQLNLDGRIAYTFAKGVTVSLSGQNLGVHHQVESVDSTLDRRVEANLEVHF
jgi:iron complex outermembrane receptor protein